MNKRRSQIAVVRSQFVEKAFGLAFYDCDLRAVIRDLRSVNQKKESFHDDCSK